MANRLSRHLRIVREVAGLLDSDKPGAVVKRGLRRYLNRLSQQAPRRGRGAATGRFVDHILALAKRHWRRLFHAYDHPKIPRTANGLEGLFGSLKRSLRCISGRASTAGGKMDSCGEQAVRVQTLTRSLSPTDLRQKLQNVSDRAFAITKQEQRRLREPARQRRSIQRDLDRFLQGTLAAWQAVEASPPRGP